MEESNKALNFAPFAAGIVAGANGTLVGHPFDTLKTRFQVGRVLDNSKMDITFVRQLYRGILPPLLTSGAIQSVNFFLFENFRARLNDSTNGTPLINGNVTSVFVAGTLSGSVVSLVSNPISVVKIRQQIVAAENIRKCVSDIYRTSGVSGFYRGYSTMYLLDASRGIYLAIYEIMKSVITDTAFQAQKYAKSEWGKCSGMELNLVSPSKDATHCSISDSSANISHPKSVIPTVRTSATGEVPGTPDSTSGNSIFIPAAVPEEPYFAPNSTSTRMLAAACTGVLSWIIIFPVDVIRVRLHLDFERKKYQNWRDCFTKTYAENGVRSFYRGISYTLIRAGPVSAASLTTYEYAKDMLEQW